MVTEMQAYTYMYVEAAPRRHPLTNMHTYTLMTTPDVLPLNGDTAVQVLFINLIKTFSLPFKHYFVPLHN